MTNLMIISKNIWKNSNLLKRSKNNLLFKNIVFNLLLNRFYLIFIIIQS